MSEPEDKKRTTHEMKALTKTKLELMPGFVRDEKRVSQVFRVVSGTAWVSIDGEDIVLRTGEELKLSHGKYDAVISSADDDPLIYEFDE